MGATIGIHPEFEEFLETQIKSTKVTKITYLLFFIMIIVILIPLEFGLFLDSELSKYKLNYRIIIAIIIAAVLIGSTMFYLSRVRNHKRAVKSMKEYKEQEKAVIRKEVLKKVS